MGRCRVSPRPTARPTARPPDDGGLLVLRKPDSVARTSPLPSLLRQIAASHKSSIAYYAQVLLAGFLAGTEFAPPLEPFLPYCRGAVKNCTPVHSDFKFCEDARQLIWVGPGVERRVAF